MTQVVVVLPARNEASSIGGSLRGVCASLDEARRRGLVGACAVEVVAHRCTDATESRARAVLRGRPGGRVVRDEESSSVGQVRDRAARRGLARLAHRPAATWVLSTDADTQVGAGWVSEILSEAARTAVVGVVGLAPLDLWHGGPQGEAAYDRLIESKMRADALHQHDHVYGANLAVRADAYLDVGGFSHVVHGEDQALVDALAGRGHRLLRTNGIRVTTSGRMLGRAEGGLAEHLSRLDAGPVVSPADADGAR
jgi:hypothetical protein